MSSTEMHYLNNDAHVALLRAEVAVARAVKHYKELKEAEQHIADYVEASERDRKNARDAVDNAERVLALLSQAQHPGPGQCSTDIAGSLVGGDVR